MKNIFLIILAINFNIALAQVNSTSQIHISGEITGKLMENDSIYFNTGLVASKYFEAPLLSSKIVTNKFNITTGLSYPHMYRILFLSDKNIRVWRLGKYFIDPLTSFVKADYSSESCNEVTGQAADEYANKFIPFFYTKKGLYDCKVNDMENLIQNKSSDYDSTLLDYVIKNPDSYVALWSLIERFNSLGQSALRQKTLEHFSKRIKDEKLWKLLNSDFKNSRIKENEKFPVLNLKTVELKVKRLSLPKAKYILIDYWFSRCRPCLDALPSLKRIYATYQSKGFEIVSISTDQTKDVPVWQKRIKENELSWIQYLDENRAEAEKLSINSFPTTFLLNNKGEIIKKYISPEDLEIFLKEHLEK